MVTIVISFWAQNNQVSCRNKTNGIRYPYSLVKQQILKIKKTTHSLSNVV